MDLQRLSFRYTVLTLLIRQVFLAWLKIKYFGKEGIRICQVWMRMCVRGELIAQHLTFFSLGLLVG